MKVAGPNTITTSLARLSSGLLFVYFGWAVVLSLEIYFGLSLNDRKLILLTLVLASPELKFRRQVSVHVDKKLRLLQEIPVLVVAYTHRQKYFTTTKLLKYKAGNAEILILKISWTYIRLLIRILCIKFNMQKIISHLQEDLLILVSG